MSQKTLREIVIAIQLADSTAKHMQAIDDLQEWHHAALTQYGEQVRAQDKLADRAHSTADAMKPLEWTLYQPFDPGLYWVVIYGETEPKLVLVKRDDKDFRVPDGTIDYVVFAEERESVLAQDIARYAGPIEIPPPPLPPIEEGDVT